MLEPAAIHQRGLHLSVGGESQQLLAAHGEEFPSVEGEPARAGQVDPRHLSVSTAHEEEGIVVGHGNVDGGVGEGHALGVGDRSVSPAAMLRDRRLYRQGREDFSTRLVERVDGEFQLSALIIARVDGDVDVLVVHRGARPLVPGIKGKVAAEDVALEVDALQAGDLIVFNAAEDHHHGVFIGGDAGAAAEVCAPVALAVGRAVGRVAGAADRHPIRERRGFVEEQAADRILACRADATEVVGAIPADRARACLHGLRGEQAADDLPLAVAEREAQEAIARRFIGDGNLHAVSGRAPDRQRAREHACQRDGSQDCVHRVPRSLGISLLENRELIET